MNGSLAKKLRRTAEEIAGKDYPALAYVPRQSPTSLEPLRLGKCIRDCYQKLKKNFLKSRRAAK